MNHEKQYCSICLDELNLKEQYIFECKCCHYYHYMCFLKYIEYNSKKIKETDIIECPLCRKYVYKYYILSQLYDRFYSLEELTHELQEEKYKIRMKILVKNIKEFFKFKKYSILSLKEEELMQRIELINKQLIKNKNITFYTRKIYYKII